jgi:transposase InsO family protein
LGVSRSHLHEQRQAVKKTARRTRNRRSRNDDAWLLPLIRRISDARPTYGYRRITALLKRELEGQGKTAVNSKRVFRIMRENGLALQKYGPRPAKVHNGEIVTIKSNIRWCSDSFRIQCWNGEKLEVAFSLDCHDREAIRWVTSTRGLDGSLVRDLMADTLEARFGRANRAPHIVQWLTDNGPGYVAYETVSFGRMIGLEVCTTAPYSPESNGMAEAFVKTFKRDYVAFGDLSSAHRVLEQLPQWFDDYNGNAPHKGLGMRSPREYLKCLQTA